MEGGLILPAKPAPAAARPADSALSQAAASVLTIDWSRPWFAPWQAHGAPAAAALSRGETVHAALNAAAVAAADPRHAPTLAVQFTPQASLPSGTAYEAHVFATRQCPTRDNLHDFFNGMVWLGLPLAKARLNALQAGQIASAGVASVRGPVRDAITVFDENGALLEAPDALWQALLARQWQRLFVELRPLWRQARLLVVGHAMLEKLCQPRKDLTAHVWRASAPLAALPRGGDFDAWLACQLSATTLAAKPFTPLPLLGVPGWWDANEDPSFYNDPHVFRLPRSSGPDG